MSREPDEIIEPTAEEKARRAKNREKTARHRERLQKLEASAEEVKEARQASMRLVLERLRDALEATEGMTPEQVADKIGAVTALVRMKLTLQVSACLDRMEASEPKVRQDAMNMFDKLMPYVTELAELDVKMKAVLGLGDGKPANTGKGKRQPLSLPAGQDGWEKQFGDTLTNKSLN